MFKSRKDKDSSVEVKSESPDAVMVPQLDEVSDSVDNDLQEDQQKTSGMFKILGKLIGVKDLINMRLSLPTQYLDPLSNLEYWGYMDQPDYFIRIPDNDDPVERLLDTVRWWLVKDSRYLQGKLVKPFNSVLGEQFFCKWQTERENSNASAVSDTSKVPSSSDDSSIQSSVDSTPVPSIGPYEVEYITEQVSHHPPVSAYVYRCKEKQIQAVGLDHLAARFASLSVIISAGSWNKGIFVTLGSRNNETYNCTHSNGQVVGWLSNKLKAISVGSVKIICPDTKLAVILELSEKNWFGRIKDVIEGAVFSYDPEKHDVQSWTVKNIPSHVTTIAKIKGQWEGKTFVDYCNGTEPVLLVDMHSAKITKKIVKPIEEQGENESRRVWGKVAEKMIKKDYTNATKLKIEVEEHQRKLAAERLERGEPFVPALFVNDFADGRPNLLPDAKLNI